MKALKANTVSVLLGINVGLLFCAFFLLYVQITEFGGGASSAVDDVNDTMRYRVNHIIPYDCGMIWANFFIASQLIMRHKSALFEPIYDGMLTSFKSIALNFCVACFLFFLCFCQFRSLKKQVLIPWDGGGHAIQT